MIFVIDTSVLVSSILSHHSSSVPWQAVERARHTGILVNSLETLHELRRVLLGKFRLPSARVDHTLSLLFARCVTVELDHSVQVCRDPKDDMFLECALRANADYLISGDKDLLTLKSFRSTVIVSPAAFLRLYP